MNIGEISTILRIHEDGIWHGKEVNNISYPDSGNDNCFLVEDNSFWFQHRNKCIVSVVKSFPPEGMIFDIGGGNGYVAMGLLNSGFEVALVEPGPVGISNAKKRGINNLIASTIEGAGFKPQSLPAVGSFDVLEHIKDNVSYLKTIRVLLKDKGKLYLTVPAYEFLWSEEDIIAGHFRRYTLNLLSRALKLSGFKILFSSYIFRFLPFPIFIYRTIPYLLGYPRTRITPKDIYRDHVTEESFQKRLLEKKLQSEIINLNNKAPMKFGGSCLVVASAE
ncbi:MAG: class I SAM-dependent methyltransferase [Candidatus Riflebacteria bacterium]|nr:class I SAM-dependent methyltransferase [Candidatus Riflebacteria bacterium]